MTQKRCTAGLLPQDTEQLDLAKNLTISGIVTYGAINTATAATSFTEALTETGVSGNVNLRYENVDHANISSDLLSLRSRVTLTSGEYHGFSAVAGLEDVGIASAIDDPYALVNDREVTELDQAYIQYQTESITATLGRQALTLDNRRFIGTAPWRQDRRTLDALRVQFKPMESFVLDFSYAYQYNQGPAELNDRDADSVILNASYTTSIGKLVAYSYLLEDKTIASEIDTYGLRFSGKTSGDYAIIYTAEFAQQRNQSFNAEYLLLETGISAAGMTAKLGLERRGSDNGNYAFATPLANAHGPNGWADVYTNLGDDGLTDRYISLSGKIERVSLTALYHEFDADAGAIDKGSELDLRATLPINDSLNVGVKYAAFSQGDNTTPDDVQKLWLWLTYTF